MSLLREIGVAIFVILAAILSFLLNPFEIIPDLPIPRRFTVRWLLVVTTAVALLIGAVVALDDVIVRAIRE